MCFVPSSIDKIVLSLYLAQYDFLHSFLLFDFSKKRPQVTNKNRRNLSSKRNVFFFSLPSVSFDYLLSFLFLLTCDTHRPSSSISTSIVVLSFSFPYLRLVFLFSFIDRSVSSLKISSN